jgi:hypothetical protein
MKKLMFAFTLMLVALSIPVAMIGCGSDDTSETSPGLVAEVLDSVASAVAQNVIDSQIVENERSEPTMVVELAVKEKHTETGLPPVNAIRIEDGLVYAGFDGGLLIYDLKGQNFSVIPVEENLEAIARHGGERFVGGDNLYQIDSAGLVRLEDEIPGQITALCSYGPSLMVGATSGLYARNMLGCVSLLEDIEVSALVSDGDGLWIGTVGDGLYRWDGDKYRKRYLVRDVSLFDHITALEYNHQHLYVGTRNGMYVYDGGSWQTVSTDEGLPSNEITAIDATGWLVRVGTTAGLATFFNNEVTPVRELQNYTITAVSGSDGRIIAGTAQQGLIVKNGPAVRVLVAPWLAENEELAMMSH